MSTPEVSLSNAAYWGRADEVASLLKAHPNLDVNRANPIFPKTALYSASGTGKGEVVKLLLAHPDILVNWQNPAGMTSFAHACERGVVAVVKLMLKDPRVNVALADNLGHTPLWHASELHRFAALEWLIESGRDLGVVVNRKVMFDGVEMRKNQAVLLLERFMANPVLTRHEVRVKLGVHDALAAEVFGMTVFMCEGLLQFRPARARPGRSTPAAPAPSVAGAIRFLTVAMKLPMELQMVLCHRVVGSMKQNILHKDSEVAFKSLARTLLLPKIK